MVARLEETTRQIYTGDNHLEGAMGSMDVRHGSLVKLADSALYACCRKGKQIRNGPGSARVVLTTFTTTGWT